MLPAAILDASPCPCATAWLTYGEERTYSIAPITPAELRQQAAAESLHVDPIEPKLKNGFLHLTARMRERLGENALCIVGVHDRIELWPAPLWEADDPHIDLHVMLTELDKLLHAD